MGNDTSPRDLWYGTSGPRDAEVVLVGEAWGQEEAAAKRPFVGQSGRELDRILAEAGLHRSNILMTNVVPERPYGNDMWRLFNAKNEAPPGSELRHLFPTPTVIAGLQQLDSQLRAERRRLIIACGNYPLWALTDHTGYATPPEANGRRVPNGIGNWRGSMTYTLAGVPCLPIYHPAGIMRQWSTRAVTVHDLKARVPMALRDDWRPRQPPLFWAPPTFEQAKMKLESWLRLAQAGHLVDLSTDIETHKGLISCIGFADSKNFAMCIPWVKKVPTGLASYWTLNEEASLVRLVRELLRHPLVRVIGQNFLYDTQYIQHWWGVTPKLDFDTMLAHHLLWPGTPKGLDYLSSLYCRYHWYWKEDGKEWDTRGTLEDLLFYNCTDCVRTFECADTLRQLIPQLGQSRQWEETKDRTSLARRMMNRGVLIDRERRGRLALELAEVLSQIDASLARIIPQGWLPPYKKGAKHVPWYRSPQQQLYVFGEILGMKIPRHRKTGNPTMGKDALPTLKLKHPEFIGIFERLEQRRSVAVFKSHFVDARLDPDYRMRCSFNPGGTETFRYSSSTNAFGRGTNLQNLPIGDEE